MSATIEYKPPYRRNDDMYVSEGSITIRSTSVPNLVESEFKITFPEGAKDGDIAKRAGELILTWIKAQK